MFDEVRLPVEVERGARGGPGFLTTISLLASGREQRVQKWEVDRGRWDIGYGVQTREEALVVRDFFMARRGRARGFRFRDWGNYTSYNFDTQAHVQQPTTEEADQSETIFQMAYDYIDSGSFMYRKAVYKPVASTIKVYIEGVEATSGWTVDSTSGLITFSTPPFDGAEVTWTGEFDLPVRFDTDQIEYEVRTKNVIEFPNLPIVELKQ